MDISILFLKNRQNNFTVFASFKAPAKSPLKTRDLPLKQASSSIKLLTRNTQINMYIDDRHKVSGQFSVNIPKLYHK